MDPEEYWHLVLALVGIVVVIVAIAAAAITLNRRSGSTYQASIQSLYAPNASSVVVTVTVVNAGGASATPTCQVDLSSHAHAENFIGANGVGSFTITSPIPPGHLARYSGAVPVNQGDAATVTIPASSVHCH